jgi:drug/metabolite transporter (DMT)-like permease
LLTAVLALIAFNRGIAILGVSRATAILLLVPLIATLLALVFLHEFPSLGEGIGIAAVSVGVLFASGIIPE